MSRATLILNNRDQRELAISWVSKAPVGSRVEFKRPKRTLDQNALLWALLTEVAMQVPWHGLRLSADDYKLLFLDAMKREVRMVPNIDGNGLVNLGRSSSDLSKDEMSDLIELIHAFGANHDVTFKNTEAPVGPVSAANPAPVDKPAPSLSTDPIRKYAAQCLATVQTEKTDPAGVIRALWMAHVELMGGPAMDQGLYTLITDIAAQCLEVLEGVVPFGKAEETIAFRLNCRLEDLR